MDREPADAATLEFLIFGLSLTELAMRSIYVQSDSDRIMEKLFSQVLDVIRPDLSDWAEDGAWEDAVRRRVLNGLQTYDTLAVGDRAVLEHVVARLRVAGSKLDHEGVSALLDAYFDDLDPENKLAI